MGECKLGASFLADLLESMALGFRVRLPLGACCVCSHCKMLLDTNIHQHTSGVQVFMVY